MFVAIIGANARTGRRESAGVHGRLRRLLRVLPQSSRFTTRGGLSVRLAMNSGCRKRPSRVHSTNDTSTTILGFTHRNAVMSSAVIPSPQCPVRLDGTVGYYEGRKLIVATRIRPPSA